MFHEGKNVHSGHRFLQKFVDDDCISVDLDVYPHERREVRWRFGRGPIASCTDEESARAAFRLLADEVPCSTQARTK